MVMQCLVSAEVWWLDFDRVSRETELMGGTLGHRDSIHWCYSSFADFAGIGFVIDSLILATGSF